MRKTTGTACREGTAYSSEILELLPIMSVVRVANVLYSVLSTIGLFLFRFFKNTFRSLYCLNFY
jgi:hypothetical protein